MIPKIIHYCWFGYKEKPKKVIDYISTWKQILPEYEIIEWNEKNFPIDYCQYTKDAYAAEKYAFVSDVARLYALKQYGGIYFDTDIEVLKSLDSYLNANMILAFESKTILMSGFIAACKDNLDISVLLAQYSNRSFCNFDGSFNMTANTVYLTEYMKTKGLRLGLDYQELDSDCKIYNFLKFGAFDADSSHFYITPETVVVHHCMASWKTRKFRTILKLKMYLSNLGRGYPYLFLRKLLGKEKAKKES